MMIISVSLYNHLCIDVTTMGVSSAFIYVWKRTREGEKQIFFGPVNMPLTQVPMMTNLALFIYGKIYIMNRNLFLLATLQLGRKTGKF